jgi:hypothetical protein
MQDLIDIQNLCLQKMRDSELCMDKALECPKINYDFFKGMMCAFELISVDIEHKLSEYLLGVRGK